jgi:molybdopterin converting factor small subunit
VQPTSKTGVAGGNEVTVIGGRPTVPASAPISAPVSVEVSVPSLLQDCTGGRKRFTLFAATLHDAMEMLLVTYPLLRLHLYDETERLRQHVLFYLNDENVAWLNGQDVGLRPGDRLSVLQNVSGG